MPQFKTRPYVVEANRYMTKEGIEAWLKKLDPHATNYFWDESDKGFTLHVKPTTGDFMEVPTSYFVIKESGGYNGFYHCNPEIFVAKYDPYTKYENLDNDTRI